MKASVMMKSSFGPRAARARERSRSGRTYSMCALTLALAATGCSKPTPAPTESAPATPASSEPATQVSPLAAPAAEAANNASVGAPAPDFTLPDLDGNNISLSQFKGKPVVLEWFNPNCPFVRASHTSGSLKGMAEKHAAKGVAWLAINSGGPGKQGNGADANREGIKQFGMTYPVLIDESGSVGKQYGAERTPHMYVVNAEGTLVYRGAIDNSPDGEGQSPEGGKLVNYVEAALTSVASGSKIETAETRPYGCSVKYKDL